jgi:hypothetical protein
VKQPTSLSPLCPLTPHIGTDAKQDSNIIVWIGYAVFMIATGIICTFWQLEPMPAELTSLGIALIGVCLFPLAKWIAGAKTGVPMFELICVAYALAYALPLFTLEHSIIIKSQAITTSWPAITRALQLSLVGAISAIIGYYIAIKSAGNRKWRIDLPMNEKETRLLSVFALIVGTSTAVPFIAYALRGTGALGNSIANILPVFVLASICQLAEVVFKTEAKLPPHKKLLFFLVAIASVTGLISGMLEATFTPIICVGVIYWVHKRKVPWSIFLITCLTLVFANDAKHAYRRDVWVTDRSYSVDEKLVFWGKAILDTVQQRFGLTEKVSSVTSESRIISRMDLLHTFAYVIESTPATVPYYWGKSYSYMFFGWIPRMFWPEKPIAAESNNMLAIDYELLSESQLQTTMTGIGIVAEAYANYSTIGCVAVLSLFGAFIAVVGNVFNGIRSDCGKAIYISVMITYANGIGSSTSQLFYFALLNMFFLTITCRVFSRSYRLN